MGDLPRLAGVNSFKTVKMVAFAIGGSYHDPDDLIYEFNFAGLNGFTVVNRMSQHYVESNVNTRSRTRPIPETPGH